jgi:hypothetical protein
VVIRPTAGVVLAAGAGSRLAPLTTLRPKALCPIAGVPLLDLALGRLTAELGEPDGDATARLAVNAHHHAEQIAAHVGGRAHVSHEQPEALGTAGALGALHDWIDGRDVLLTNADAFLPSGLALVDGSPFATGWEGDRCRLACVVVPEGEGRADFRLRDGRGVRYVGTALLPWALVRDLPARPGGLYEALWRAEHERGTLDLQVIEGDAIDCGTVADYLRANLRASGGTSVVGTGASVRGTITRCVVWDGSEVRPGEHLVDVVRACGLGVTFTVGAQPGG